MVISSLPPAIEAHRLLTAREVCALLRISKPKLYSLIHTGAIGSLKIDGCRRFTISAVDDYIAARLAAEREAKAV